MAYTNNDRYNTKIIKVPSDWPTAVGGVITLEDNTTYIVNGTCVMSDRIVTGVSNAIIGVDKSDDKLVYTGTGNFITSTNQDLTIGGVLLSASTGTLFNITGDGTNNIELKELIIGSTATIGSIGGFDNLIIRSCLFTGITTDGLDITGTTNNKVLIVDNVIENIVGTAIDLGTSNSDVYHLDRNEFNIAAGRTGISGLTASGNPNITGRITNNTFLGAGTYVNNILPSDEKWGFDGNSGDNGGIDDTQFVGELYFTGSTATVISTIDTYVKVAGTAVAGEVSGFQVNVGAKELQYTGTKPRLFRLVGALSGTGETSNKQFTVAFAVNDVIQTKTEITSTPDSARATAWALSGLLKLSANDRVSIYVKNISDTSNITITKLNFTAL